MSIYTPTCTKSVDNFDNINYKDNCTKYAILNNNPIDNNLHVISVISNPCNYKRRYSLACDYIKRMEDEQNVILYIVELAFNDQKFYVTQENNPRHLQLRTHTAPLWHKENMINIGIKKLLPQNWKAMAWVDADIEFENPYWALDTLKILNGAKDVVQLFSHAVDMNAKELAMNVFSGFGYQYCKKLPYQKGGKAMNQYHPGYGWAITRKAFDNVGYIYEDSILGSGDHNMALAFIGDGIKSLHANVDMDYKQSIYDFERKCKGLRLGYTPGIIRHYFHGAKAKRFYVERWQVLIKHKYSPQKHIEKNKDGLLVPSKNCPPVLLKDIYDYFDSRDEDEGLREALNLLKL
jgi:hypothetical protein